MFRKADRCDLLAIKTLLVQHVQATSNGIGLRDMVIERLDAIAEAQGNLLAAINAAENQSSSDWLQTGKLLDFTNKRLAEIEVQLRVLLNRRKRGKK